jgi:hypothetical protein
LALQNAVWQMAVNAGPLRRTPVRQVAQQEECRFSVQAGRYQRIPINEA